MLNIGLIWQSREENNMFYELVFDMDRIDEALKKGESTIYAEKHNLRDIQYPEVKQGYFRYVINKGEELHEWPNVVFYYSSKASSTESEYLLNVAGWPIIHRKVQKEFERQGIEGVQYLAIILFDVVTDTVNNDYVVMNVLNKIEAYDLEKNQYTYDEKYDLYTFIPVNVVMDTKECSKYDIFAPSKDMFKIHISQKVKDIIEENEWIGFDFRKYKND